MRLETHIPQAFFFTDSLDFPVTTNAIQSKTGSAHWKTPMPLRIGEFVRLKSLYATYVTWAAAIQHALQELPAM